MRLDEITQGMVDQRHAALAKTLSTANHLLKYFRTVYNYARRTEDLPETPTTAIEWYPEPPSGETTADLRAWRRTVDALENPIHREFYELLLFTQLRKTGALTLEWKHAHEDRLHLPMTKDGRSFDLPIRPLHHEMLARLEGLSRRWVFPSPRGPEGRLGAPKRLQWSPHAHRWIVAVEAGVLEKVVGRPLNHTPLSITGQRYAKPSLDALRPAMEVVCTEIGRRLGTPASSSDRFHPARSRPEGRTPGGPETARSRSA
ncbi:hypothetical protein [Vannielia litorea]|uniref:hypothetical protein n=1 Tax=Vannielia litorea TaxID=1217970 RepID=UPI0028F6F698|nr:hypothetical protein [Vannielia litorea]